MSNPSQNRVHLNYEDDGEGQPVLLLHPVGLDLTWWREVTEALLPHFRVLRVDLRGHGQSPVFSPPSRMEDFATDVHAVLGELDLGPAHVVGQSFGGMVAQVLAIDFPQDVRSLVLSGTHCTASADQREVFAARAAAAERGGMEAVAQSTIERWFTQRAMDSDLVEHARQRLLTDSVDGWAAAWRAIAGFDALPRLPEISVPTLVTTGDADVAAPPEASQKIAETIPSATLRIMEGAPHMAPYERPDLFIPLVKSFLKSVAGV